MDLSLSDRGCQGKLMPPLGTTAEVGAAEPLGSSTLMATGTGPLLRRTTSRFSSSPASRPPARAWMSVAVSTTPSRSSGNTMLVV